MIGYANILDYNDDVPLVGNEESSGCSVDDKEDFEGDYEGGSPGASGNGNVYYFKSSSFSQSTSMKAAMVGNNISLHMMSLKHVGACVMKNLIGLYRSKALMAFQFLLPFIQISIFLLAVGANPKNVPVGIANEDRAPSKYSLSERFITYLNGDLMKLKFFKNLHEAQKHEEGDRLSAIVHFGPDFTVDMIERASQLQNASVDVALGSSIYISLDRTVFITSLLIQESIARAYGNFLYDLIDEMTPNTTLLISPLNFTAPLFGEDVHTFTDYMAPGMYISEQNVFPC